MRPETIVARQRPRSFTAPITGRPRTVLPAAGATMPAFPPPRLAPLRGNLGRPMLNAGGAPDTAIFPAPAVDPEARRRARAIEAARLSGVFASSHIRERPIPRQPLPFHRDASAQPVHTAQLSTDARARSAWAPASAFVVQAGTVIPGALITVRSDLLSEHGERL